LAWLAGLPVGDPPEARQAAWALGVPSVLATSIPASDNRLANVLVQSDAAIACYVRRRAKAPHGTGDLLAAIYLGRRLSGEAPAKALGAAASAVDASVAASKGGDELPLATVDALWASARALPTTPV
jgi:pyridoxine kinase